MRLKGMKKPPLQMEFYYFPEINIRINLPKKELRPEDSEIDFDVSTAIAQFDTDEMCYRVELRIKAKEIDGKFKAYDADVLAVGFFKIDKSVPAEKRGEIATILGSNLLYGAARELFYQLTSRGPHRAIHLPTTSFVPELQPPKEALEQPKKTEKKKQTSHGK